MLSSSTVDWVTVAMRPGSVAARMGSHCALLSTYWCCRRVSDRSLTDWTCALQAAPRWSAAPAARPGSWAVVEVRDAAVELQHGLGDVTATPHTTHPSKEPLCQK